MLPTLTAEDRARALAAAAEARTARKEALDEIRTGALAPADALTRPGPLQGVKVRTLLLAAQGIGATKADRLLTEAGVAENRRRTVRVQGLGANQRARLTALLTAG